ncbi:MAG: SUMF1/EgtB/PvdO family nonheme iron enzyme [Planctomycetes bacterium]|nr:SUMF1/EgtB/PvdO family nonheme iron enzyme [Planctomycetota bacterium]
MGSGRDVQLVLRAAAGDRVDVQVIDTDGATRWESVADAATQLPPIHALRTHPLDGALQASVELAVHQWLARFPATAERLRQHVPSRREEPAQGTRFVVEVRRDDASEDAWERLHSLPFELLTLPTNDESFEHAPLVTDRCALVRYVSPAPGTVLPPASPLARDPRALLVIGRLDQGTQMRDCVPGLLRLLQTLATELPPDSIRLAVTKPTLTALHARASATDHADAVAWLEDLGRTTELTAIRTLLDLLGNRDAAFDVVVFIGHSFEVATDGSQADRSRVDERDAATVSTAAALDLGLPRPDPTSGPSGPTFAELSDALSHGATRVFAAWACKQGPGAARTLLSAVDHVVLTSARIQPDWAAASLAELLVALLHERRTVDEAVRRARHADSIHGRPFVLQHWLRRLDAGRLTDPTAGELAAYCNELLELEKLEIEDSPLFPLVTVRGDFVRLTVEERLLHERATDRGARDEYAAEARAAALARRSEGAEHSQGDRLLTLLDWSRRHDNRLSKDLVVVAGPGAGKTVMLLRVRSLLAADPERYWVPVFVRLRSWLHADRTGDILRHAVALHTGANAAYIPDDHPTLRALCDAMRRRRVAFLLDGLDEVPVGDLQQRAKALIHALARERGCPVVVTTRPIGYEALEGRFVPLGLAPLDGEARRRLSSGLLDVLLPDDAERQSAVRAALRDRIERSPTIERLVGNPLFLTLMLQLLARVDNREREGVLPAGSRPSDILRELVDYLLLQKHHVFQPSQQGDDTRFTDPDAVRAALAELAFWMTRELRADLDPTALTRWAQSPEARRRQSALRECGDWTGNMDWQRFLESVLRRTGLVSRVREGRVAVTWQFRHRALQEYLTAEVLAELHRDSVRGAEAVLRLAASAAAADAARDERLNYWAEPFAFLAGLLTEGGPDAWIRELASNEATRALGLRALLTAHRASADTILAVAHGLDDEDERAMVVRAVAELLPEPELAAGALVALAQVLTKPADLYVLREQLEEAGRRGAIIDDTRRSALYAATGEPDGEALTWLADTWWCRRHGEPREFLWKPVAPGSFEMGSPPDEADRRDNEDLVDVEITRCFWVMAVPVTLGILRALHGDHFQHRTEDSRLPAVNLNWFEATTFCDWLNARWLEAVRGGVLDDETARMGVHGVPSEHVARGWQFRLLTEAEWEFMCRAGTTTRFWSGDDLEVGGEAVAWDTGNSGRRLHAVAELQPNGLGVYDAHGLVWEWCRDWYGDALAGGRDPVGPERGSDRVLRGGSFGIVAGLCRSAFRNGLRPGVRFFVDYDNYGFRVCFGPPLQNSDGVFEDR